MINARDLSLFLGLEGSEHQPGRRNGFFKPSPFSYGELFSRTFSDRSRSKRRFFSLSMDWTEELPIPYQIKIGNQYKGILQVLHLLSSADHAVRSLGILLGRVAIPVCFQT